ncbi:hypothetical protein Bca4012_100124 [Brassica carinata]
MVRKTRTQQYVEDDDIPATQQSVNELQAQVTALVAAVAALTTQNAAPALRNRRNTRPNNNDDSAEEEDDNENPFAPLQRTQQNRNNNNDFDSDNDVNKKSWKSSFKHEIPEFKGSTIPEELMDWFVTVEEIVEFKEIPLDRCVPFIAIRFRDRAAAWWSQTKTTRNRLGKSKISTWSKLKKEMQKKNLPYNYDQLMFQKLQSLRQGSRTATPSTSVHGEVEVQDNTPSADAPAHEDGSGDHGDDHGETPATEN